MISNKHPCWKAMAKMKINPEHFMRLVGWDILTTKGTIICDAEYVSPRMAEAMSQSPGDNGTGHKLPGLGD